MGPDGGRPWRRRKKRRLLFPIRASIYSERVVQFCRPFPMNRLHGGSVGWTNEKSHGEGQRNNNKKEEEEEERTGSSFVSSSSNEGHIIPQKVRRPGPAPTRFDLIHFFDTPRNFYDFSSSFARRGGYITDSRVLPGFFFFLFVVAATYPSETTHNVSMIFSSLKQSNQNGVAVAGSPPRARLLDDTESPPISFRCGRAEEKS